MAKTGAQKQKDRRIRLSQQGLTEVRGIYAKPEHHKLIKEFAKQLSNNDALKM